MKQKTFNLSNKIFDKKQIINEADIQSGKIEFSMTGELIPLERVEVILKEFIEELKKEGFQSWKKEGLDFPIGNYFDFIDKIVGKRLSIRSKNGNNNN